MQSRLWSWQLCQLLTNHTDILQIETLKNKPFLILSSRLARYSYKTKINGATCANISAYQWLWFGFMVVEENNLRGKTVTSRACHQCCFNVLFWKIQARLQSCWPCLLQWPWDYLKNSPPQDFKNPIFRVTFYESIARLEGKNFNLLYFHKNEFLGCYNLFHALLAILFLSCKIKMCNL